MQFQRGGLPHSHLVLKLPHALDNAATIDYYVQAYLPKQHTHPRSQLHTVLKNLNFHTYLVQSI